MLLRVGTGASTVRLDRTSPEVYFGTGQLDRAGTVRLTAVIRRAGQRIEAPVAWSVDPATRPPAARAEAAQPAAAPGRGLGSTVAILAPPLLGALVLGVRRLVRARSRRPAEELEEVLEGAR